MSNQTGIVSNDELLEFFGKCREGKARDKFRLVKVIIVNEQLALDPDDDFERYILLDLDDETLIEDAFFKRQGAWRPLTEAFRKRWGKRSELMDKISLAQFGEKSNYAIYSFERPFWFEYECDPQDTATAEDPEGYGLGFEFDMTKEEAIEKQTGFFDCRMQTPYHHC